MAAAFVASGLGLWRANAKARIFVARAVDAELGSGAGRAHGKGAARRLATKHHFDASAPSGSDSSALGWLQ